MDSCCLSVERLCLGTDGAGVTVFVISLGWAWLLGKLLKFVAQINLITYFEEGLKGQELRTIEIDCQHQQVTEPFLKALVSGCGIAANLSSGGGNEDSSGLLLNLSGLWLALSCSNLFSCSVIWS